MLNPIAYTENVVSDFLRYQLTAYPFSDSNLYEQMRTLLNLETTRSTPLLKGPYISLSQVFQQGVGVEQLIESGIFHTFMKSLIPYPSVYGHQETAIRAIHAGKTTLVSTGTGSGKTECFLYPIISHCLKLREQGAPQGISAVIVYPMNALAEDQLGRLRGLLAGTGISFGMYVGKTPEQAAHAAGTRLKPGASKADYQAAVQKAQAEKRPDAVFPPEERVSREEMREKPPRILLTNVKQLELLLTRQRDITLFDNARLDFFVFDEAHTFSGANGAETACLIRRLRAFCGKSPTETVCVATSATIADPNTSEGLTVAQEFASRFFGIPEENVALVGEQYQEDVWADQRQLPEPLAAEPATLLKYVLTAVEQENPGPSICHIYRQITGISLDPDHWQAQLYDSLAANALVHKLATQVLKHPRHLSDVLRHLQQLIDRPVSEEEVLIWLALGAASRRDGRPLLRPVIHGFVRGVGGAVVTFPKNQERPKLWLSAEDTAGTNQDDLYRLPVLTCNTCGQHYFAHSVADFKFTDKQPAGGQAHGDLTLWKPLGLEHEGDRLLLVDRLITQDEDETESKPRSHPRSTIPIHFCRACGTLHSDAVQQCGNCGRQGDLISLLVVRQKPKHPGHLSSCIACQASGRSYFGRYREPARPIRATAVSDVHVLAQNMLHHAERKRLLVFADNRQDAAFQAGWMQDHARRYRLRSLMYDQIADGAISIGDLTAQLDAVIDADDDLSRSLIPEVWRVHRKEAEGLKHAEERKCFLRIQILREITAGVKQRIGLEPWGRIQIEYADLTPDLDFIQHWAPRLGVPPEDLVQGIATLLDVTRRNNILLDREGYLFSKKWKEGDFEIQRGYMPILTGVPRGLKLTRESGDTSSRVQQWLSPKGDTVARQAARSWCVAAEDMDVFFQELWYCLQSELKLLVPSVLKNAYNKPLRGCEGVYQLDADKLRILPSSGVYRCGVCRRSHPRPTPRMACPGWRCDGTIAFEPESPDDYDLRVLDEQFEMLRPEEHSAQVPHEKRDRIERIFKGDSELINSLVCTPTLEMGVDIGSLDSVLMRNVPPLPSNYWQRAGRAGRRHRMAVNLTYARGASHDRAYFKEPLRLLEGQIDPPKLNLRNTLMVGKHVRATVLTALHQMARSAPHLTQGDREEIASVLATCFPGQVKAYLFDDTGYIRRSPLDVSALTDLLQKHALALYKQVAKAFAETWPLVDAMAVQEKELKQHIAQMGDKLTDVIDRLWKRLQWAMSQIRRLSEERVVKGSLDPEGEALFRRCDRLVKKLKGQSRGRRSDAEGFDDTVTYSVLAAEGFLPGYGLDIGSVRGTALMPRSISWMQDFELPRPSSVALREYVPGNLIYANGQRFVPRYFHLEPDDPTYFQVDIGNEAIKEIGAGQQLSASLLSSALKAVPMCDVDLSHQSNISDDEDNRFQMPVTILGYEQDRHSGGLAFNWGVQPVQLRQNVHFRLVNVGPANRVRTNDLGYTICLVCGQSRSPFTSDRDLQLFLEDHKNRCGSDTEPTGVFADVIADALSFQDCENREVAYSVMEAIRHGASNILEMDLEDLQLLTIGHSGTERVDVLLYDPMPGGSGLLEQLTAKWPAIVDAAIAVVGNCQSRCETACIDCLFNFRNAYYHRFLNRHTALKKLQQWGDILTQSHPIPAKLPSKTEDAEHRPVNAPEKLLQTMLERAGFPDAIPQKSIDLGRPLGSTTPDFFFEDPNDLKEGICLYLDGMSRSLHGDPERSQKDQAIRDELVNEGYEVVTITCGDLSDHDKMAKILFRIGRMLLGKQQAKAIRDRADWFDVPQTPETAAFSGNTNSSSDLDLALFDPQWRHLIQQIANDQSLTVDAGSDIQANGQVIGQYFAEIKRGDCCLKLCDRHQPQAEAVHHALQAQGHPVALIEAGDPTALQNILNQLQEASKQL